MHVRDTGVALWRQRPLVLLVLVVTGLAVVAGIWLAPKSYTATATLRVGAEPTSAPGDGELASLRATLAEQASSTEVAEEARERSGSDRSVADLRTSIEGRWRRGTELVDVSATDPEPAAAAALATAAAGALTDPAVTGQDRLEVSVSEAATVPGHFSRPDPWEAGALGALLAVGLALVAAVWRDRRTHTVGDAATVEAATGAPLLGHLVPPRDLTDLPALRPGTLEADVFRHLLVAVERHSARTVVAGVTGDDVNVWVGANLAVALARTGRRVLLVDGRMGDRFGAPVEDAPDTPGLYDVLLGADLADAISPGPVDLLQVLPPGTRATESIEDLLASRFEAVMARAESSFDHVLVLGPPLEVADDARVMAVGGSLVLTVVAGAVAASALRAHADRVRSGRVRLLGAVLLSRRTAKSAT